MRPQEQLPPPGWNMDEELAKLRETAQVVIDRAKEEFAARPDAGTDIFEAAAPEIEQIYEGALGPASSASDPGPALEDLGTALGVFDQQAIEGELVVVVKCAMAAANALDDMPFTMVFNKPDGTTSMKTVKKTSTLDEVMAALAEDDLSLDGLDHLEVIKQYYSHIRCKLLWDKDAGVLRVKGWTDFVSQVTDASE